MLSHFHAEVAPSGRAVDSCAAMAGNSASWPRLLLPEWQDTLDTLHMWLQIVGKIRKTLTPAVNLSLIHI